VAGERHVGHAWQLDRAAPCELELLQPAFKEDHNCLPTVSGRRHRSGVVHDHTASA
jgi:hypothetical protein